MRNQLAITAAILLGACTQASETPTVDKAAEQAAIEAVEAAQIAAINAHDAAGGAAAYAPDATLYMPGSAPLSGDALTAAFDEMAKDEALAVAVDEGTEKTWIADSGEMAVTSFTGTFTSTGADGQPAPMHMAVQTLWHKQDDGSWKIVGDFNMEIPAAE